MTAENVQLRRDLYRANMQIREAKAMTRKIAAAIGELPEGDYPPFLACLGLISGDPAEAGAIIAEFTA